MSILTVPTVKFTNNLELALQQKTAKLAPYAMQQAGSGEMTEVTNIVGSALPDRKTARFQPTNLKNGEFERRWAPRTEEYTFARGVDSTDKLEALIDIQGGYTMTAAATLERARDVAFLEGFYGPNHTGKTGTTLVNFDAGNIVPVDTGAAAPTGMNVDKLRAAQKRLRKNHVDLSGEEAFMALTAEQIADLQSEIEMTSYDFNRMDAPVLREGKLTRMLGFNFVEMEFGDEATVGPDIAQMTLDANGYRRVPFWVRSGMAIVTWEQYFARITERDDLHFAIQVYARNCQTGTRTQEGKCGQVLCLEPS